MWDTTQLITEIPAAPKDQRQLKGKGVLDRRSGLHSIRKAVFEAGACACAGYIAVDAMGEREVKDWKPRRAAIDIAVRHNSSVLAVRQKLKDGSKVRTIPGGAGEMEESYEPLHAAGARGLRKGEGVGQRVWGGLADIGPTADALPNTAYYAYRLNHFGDLL